MVQFSYKSDKERSQRMLARDSKVLLLLHGLFNISTTLSNLFVGIYLWKIEKDYTIIAAFYLMVFTFSTLTYVMTGWLLGKWGRTRLFQIGILFQALFFTIVLVLKEGTADHAIILGMIYGNSLGLYWLPFNVLVFDFTNSDNRSLFYGINGLIVSGAGFIGPLISGFILNHFSALSGYQIIFSISLSIFLLTGILSFLLGNYKTQQKYQFNRIIRPVNWSGKWRQLLVGSFMYGLREGIFMFIISLLVYISTNSELSLGWYSSLTSILSTAAFYIVGRIISQRKNSQFLFIGIISILLATLALAFEVNYFTLLLFGCVNALFTPCLVIPFSTICFDLINQDPFSAKLRTEYIVLRELFINMGRVIPVLIFICFFDGENTLILKLFLLLPSIALLGVWWYLRKINLSHT
jgi:MFS transporter, YQGE family, putative transporter